MLRLMPSNNAHRILAALDRSLAIIEFTPQGEIIGANKNFLECLGYKLEEIVGRNHSMFVPASIRESGDYKTFWNDLRSGEYKDAEFPRVRKDGQTVWIRATYNPVMEKGRVVKVVKFAADVTREKRAAAAAEGQIAAINKSQAVIHFTPDGTILDANDNFLKAMGYKLDEIRGQHHSMFVEAGERASACYRDHWDALARGEYKTGEFKRLGKGGRTVYIQATYNPILDETGRTTSVVKFAVDRTAQVTDRLRRIEIQKEIDTDLGRIFEEISDTSRQAASAASASTQTSSNVQAVASGAEELAASVAEISQQVTHALRVTEEAVQDGERTNAIVGGLAEAAQRIGDIVDLINNIASQTNLLALNATIEAARAGEAGKGFSVVATEVKSLASQTSKATDEIGSQILAVQQTTQQAVEALKAIGDRINDINEISSSIASAVEEQAAVTRDMSSNMQTAADGVDTITRNMNAIASSTRQVETTTNQVREVSKQIA
ncbi:methyl-accepting chemotaxis protein [Amorphus orientalis]|uniref:Methyl-accepting chemotaxis protein n=1 Tax=Amorphus orientalis TaxID=649198 RepID=A0AAE3VMM9_9HYPH|nr:PAS domain-containing methyl-accepting chemotaxis protein [Amorphus orientalis]MDQ0314765.1 methyl-accepting chemotaxis protein [Amorphus orientalis]